MSDARDFARDRAAIANAVLQRVGGDRVQAAALLDEIAGGFSPLLHRAVVGLMPSILGAAFGGPRFDLRVLVEGPLERIRDLSAHTTLVLAPTHASNLDSLVLGIVAGRAGLPPFAYAAGKHIYRHRLFAALMPRLGAYQLDPDRHDRLYLRLVNVYVHELLARGYHTVVFPSGTRCRSGEVETRLKLGLLGAAIHVRGPLAVVPITINYQVVLEAEHLIAYHLAGRAHERIVGDELFVWGRLRDTARRLAALDQRVVIRFGEPIDPRGGEGSWRSRLATSLVAAYRRNTVYLATHIVARALFELGADEVPRARARAAVSASSLRLAADPSLGRPWCGLDGASPDDVLESALHAWRTWHRTPPAILRDDAVVITGRELLLFYRNRSAHIP